MFAAKLWAIALSHLLDMACFALLYERLGSGIADIELNPMAVALVTNLGMGSVVVYKVTCVSMCLLILFKRKGERGTHRVATLLVVVSLAVSATGVIALLQM